jgi:hypothetical protein
MENIYRESDFKSFSLSMLAHLDLSSLMIVSWSILIRLNLFYYDYMHMSIHTILLKNGFVMIKPITTGFEINIVSYEKKFIIMRTFFGTKVYIP